MSHSPEELKGIAIAGRVSSVLSILGSFAIYWQYKNRFPVADVLWTFAMALDTYLVVFYHFDTQSLRKLEIKYIGVITILSFIPAFVFLFIRDHKGPIYGDETVSTLNRLETKHVLRLTELS